MNMAQYENNSARKHKRRAVCSFLSTEGLYITGKDIYYSQWEGGGVEIIQFICIAHVELYRANKLACMHWLYHTSPVNIVSRS
jgi:hypothetical protein